MIFALAFQFHIYLPCLVKALFPISSPWLRNIRELSFEALGQVQPGSGPVPGGGGAAAGGHLEQHGGGGDTLGVRPGRGHQEEEAKDQGEQV